MLRSGRTFAFTDDTLFERSVSEVRPLLSAERSVSGVRLSRLPSFLLYHYYYLLLLFITTIFNDYLKYWTNEA